MKVTGSWERLRSPKTSVMSELCFQVGNPLLFCMRGFWRQNVRGGEGEGAGWWGEALLRCQLGASVLRGRLARDRNLKPAALE